MKIKKILFILFIILLINIKIDNVKAFDSSSCAGKENACAVCSYGLKQYFTIDFLVESNSNTIKYTEDYNTKTKNLPTTYNVNSIKNSDFISDDKIVCPDKIKYTIEQDRVLFNFYNGSINVSLNNNSYNNNKNIKSNNITNNSSNNTTSSNTPSSSSSTNTNNKSNELTTGNRVEGCEILGTEFFEYLKAIFFWIKVLGPFLALILTMADLVHAISSLDEDVKKKAYKKIPTRFIATILLILVPSLVEILLSVIDNINGTTCGL